MEKDPTPNRYLVFDQEFCRIVSTSCIKNVVTDCILFAFLHEDDVIYEHSSAPRIARYHCMQDWLRRAGREMS